MPFPDAPILLVDDEEQTLISFEIAFNLEGFDNIITCHEPAKVMALVEAHAPELVVMDQLMPGITGEELLERIHSTHPDIPVIMVTGVNDVAQAVSCMRLGAFDYILKPVDITHLLNRVKKAVEARELRRENGRLRDQLLSGSIKHPEHFAPIVTRDPKMLSVFHYIEAIAQSSEPVLITGETGTGKELVAQATHAASGRQGQFVTVNVAGVDDNLFSDTLFGHLKGAFTGATANRPGMIEKAAGGTLFLDEIGDLTVASQVKLLRLTQDKEYCQLGSDQPRRSSARVVLATHKKLDALMRSGAFRNDLYYRISTHKIHLPPLRERPADLEPLLERFLQQAAEELGRPTPIPSPDLAKRLAAYEFPGNVRELRAMVFQAMSRCLDGKLTPDLFREYLGDTPEAIPAATGAGFAKDFNAWLLPRPDFPGLKDMDELLVAASLEKTHGNQAAAAKLLGISPPALCKRLKHATPVIPLTE